MKILTELQESVLEKLFAVEEIRRHFYLTGGTALSAFYLEHRFSDDLDLFTHSVAIDSVDRVIVDAIRDMKLTMARERSSSTFRRYIAGGELQIDLVHDIEFRIGAPELRDGIMIDAKKNIAVNKVCAIYGRLDAKDYVDLYFLLKDGEYDILDLISLAKSKDGGMEPFQWAKVIADADVLSILPRMAVPCDLDEVKKFFRKLRERVVDAAKPQR